MAKGKHAKRKAHKAKIQAEEAANPHLVEYHAQKRMHDELMHQQRQQAEALRLEQAQKLEAARIENELHEKNQQAEKAQTLELLKDILEQPFISVRRIPSINLFIISTSQHAVGSLHDNSAAARFLLTHTANTGGSTETGKTVINGEFRYSPKVDKNDTRKPEEFAGLEICGEIKIKGQPINDTSVLEYISGLVHKLYLIKVENIPDQGIYTKENYNRIKNGELRLNPTSEPALEKLLASKVPEEKSALKTGLANAYAKRPEPTPEPITRPKIKTFVGRVTETDHFVHTQIVERNRHSMTEPRFRKAIVSESDGSGTLAPGRRKPTAFTNAR